MKQGLSRGRKGVMAGLGFSARMSWVVYMVDQEVNATPRRMAAPADVEAKNMGASAVFALTEARNRPFLYAILGPYALYMQHVCMPKV